MAKQSQFSLLKKRRFLPLFLFSALGGQFGEKFAKDSLIRIIKIGEIGIMPVGAAGLLLGSLPLLLAVLFAVGTQSVLFGSLKYSILPQHLQPDELIGGNALVEMGTFLAILGGTLYAGLLMSGAAWSGWVAGVVPMALRGLWGSFFSRHPHKGLFRRFWSRVCLVAGKAIPAEQVTAELMRGRVAELRGQAA